jgi:hypothetical protein
MLERAGAGDGGTTAKTAGFLQCSAPDGTAAAIIPAPSVEEIASACIFHHAPKPTNPKFIPERINCILKAA